MATASASAATSAAAAGVVAAERSDARHTYNAALAPLGRAHVGRQQIEAARRTLRGPGDIAFDTPNNPCAS